MKIINTNDGSEFHADAGIDIVSAALRTGCAITHSCRQGICGACSGRVISGQFTTRGSEEHVQIATKDSPIDVLLCQTLAVSDLDVSFDPRLTDIPSYATKILSMNFPAKDIAIIELKIISGGQLSFKAGQFIAIKWIGGQKKYFSIASAENSSNKIEIHVRKQPNGLFTNWLFENARVNDVLGIEGPLGDFTWKTPPHRPILLLATGTGFSPIKSLVESHKLWSHPSPVFLYWGGRSVDDFYMSHLAVKWSELGTDFHFIPVASHADDESWNGRTGYIPENLIIDHPDISNYDVYACGAPPMLEAAKTQLTSQCKLDTSHFFADSFTPQPHASAPSPELIYFNIKFKDGVEGRVSSEPGTSLLQALLNLNLRLDHYCGGGAVCATCKVNIQGGSSNTSDIEIELFDCLSEVQTGDRLACQVYVDDQISGSCILLPGTPDNVSNLGIMSNE